MNFISCLGWIAFTLPLLLTVAAQAQSPQQQAAFEALAQAPDDSGRLSSLLDAWLDEEGFDKLRTHLKSQSDDSTFTVADWKAAAGIWERLRDGDEALKACAKATELAPTDSSLWLQRARLEARRTDFEAALGHLDKISLKAEEGVLLEALKLHQAISRQLGDRDKFQTWLTRVAEARKNDPRLHLEIARLQRKTGDAREQAEWVAQQVAAAPDDLRQEWRLLGVDLAVNQRNLANTQKLALAGLAESAPGSALERDFLGYLLATPQPPNGSPAVLMSPQALAETLSDRPKAVLALARQLKGNGQPEEALRLLEKQAAVTPDDVMLLRERAEALVDAGREGEAIAVLQRHLTTHPEADGIRVLLSLTLHEYGRNEEAARLLESWAGQPNAPARRVTQVLTLLPLMRRQQEMDEWKAGLPSQPQAASATAPASPAAPPAPLAMPVSSRKPLDGKAPLKQPLAAWRESPHDLEAATALMQAFQQTRRPAEQEFLFMRMHESLPDRESRLKWWRRGAYENMVSGNGIQLPMALLNQESGRQNSADDWVVRAEVLKLTGQNEEAVIALDEAVRLEPGNAALRRQWLQNMIHAGWGLRAELSAGSSASDRLLLALVDFQAGRVDSARRTVLELAHDPSLDATHAIRLARALMTWREWKAAGLFIAAQRSRFPQDYRLAGLEVLMLRETGHVEGAVALLMQMGNFSEEVPSEFSDLPFQMRGQHAGNPNGESLSAQWMQINMASSQALDYRKHFSPAAGTRSGESQGGSLYLFPQRVSLAGSWAMAHLLDLAQNLPPAERAVLAERARLAGLPFPDVLIFCRLQMRDNAPRLVMDPEAVKPSLTDPDLARLCMQTLQRGMEPGVAGQVEMDLLRQCHATLLKTDPALSLDAALLGWTWRPDSPDAVTAVVQSLDIFPPEGQSPYSKILSSFHALPGKVLRDPKTVDSLAKALNGWHQRSLNRKPGQPHHSADLAACHLWLGRWADAAKFLEAAQTPPSQPEASAAADGDGGKPAPVTAIYLGQNSQFSWPPRAHFPGSFQSLINRPAHNQAPGISEGELPAFKTAGEGLKSPLLKTAWLLLAQEEAAAATHIRQWLAAEPESEAAVHIAVSLALHENDRVRALDHLYNWMVTRPVRSAAQRLAQLRYVETALFPTKPVFLRHGSLDGGPQLLSLPASHLERLRVAAKELLPSAKKGLELGGEHQVWIKAYEALGLKGEAQAIQEASNVKRPLAQPGRRGNWLNLDIPMLRQEMQRQMWSRHRASDDLTLFSHNAEALITAGQRGQAVQMIFLDVRRRAAHAYFGYQGFPASHDHWGKTIAQHKLADELMQAAEPGKRRTALRLLHAAEVANACGRWEAMQGFLKEALRLLPHEPGVSQALLLSLLRTDTPAALVRELEPLPRQEVSQILEGLLRHVRQSQDTGYRIDAAEVLVLMTSKRPEWVVLEPRAGAGFIESLFELLTKTQQSETGSLPPYYPELARDGSGNDSPSKAPPELMQRRKALHNQLCDLAIQHPEWGAGAAVHLINRHLVENQPTEDELLKYLQVMTSPQGSPQFVYNLISQHSHLTNLGIRQKLAALVMKFLPALEPAVLVSGWRADSMLEVIGGAVSARDLPKLYALWEWPGDITQSAGSRYTPSQVAWNKERQAMMKAFCFWALDRPELRAGVFPRWAAYRLHSDTRFTDVLAQARLLKDHESDPYGLREFVRMAGTSLSNRHYIKTAEFVLAVLQEPGSNLDLAALKPSLAEVMGRLVNGRDNPAGRLPPLALSPEDAAAHAVPLPASWQKRRQKAYQQLEELLASQDILPVATLFVRLEKALLSGEDTAPVEEKIIQLADTEAEVVGVKLTEFIQKTRGTDTKERNRMGAPVYVGGVWDIDQRVRWLESAWRIGRALPEGKGASATIQPKWLRPWIDQAVQANDKCTPAVTSVFGLHNDDHGASYEIHPLLKRRDELFMKAMEWCLERGWDWSYSFSRFARIHMSQQTPSSDAVLKVALDQLQKSPSNLAAGLFSWLNGDAVYESPARISSSLKIAGQIMARWPKEDRSSQSNWLTVLKEIVRWGNSGRSFPSLELLPGQWWSQLRQPDPLLQQTPLIVATRNEWLHIVNLAAEIPAFRPAVFADFARVHLSKSPEKVVAVAREMLAGKGDALGGPLVTIYELEEIAAPLSRRLAWGTLVLELLSQDARHEDSASYTRNASQWLKSTLRYLHETPRNFDDGRPKLPTPTEEELKQRDELEQRLMALTQDDPELALEGLVGFARQQFRTQGRLEAVHARVQQALAHDPVKLAAQLNAWVDDLSSENASDEEKIWALQVLAATAEKWSVDEKAAPANWIPSSLRLFRNAKDDGELPSGMAPYFDRLFEAGMKQPPQVVGMLEASGRYIGADPARQQRLVNHILSVAGADLNKATEWMTKWWEYSLTGWMPTGSTRARTARTAVLILHGWPQDAPAETLLWTQDLLMYLAAPGVGARYFIPVGPIGPKTWPTAGMSMVTDVPAAPKNAEILGVSKSVVEEMLRRQMGGGWLVPIRMRLACNAAVTAEERIQSMQPLFTDDKMRKVALDYLADALADKVPIKEADHSVMHFQSHLLPPDPQVEEVLDAVRCLQAVIQKSWVPAESLAALEEKAKARLDDILAQSAPSDRPVMGRQFYHILATQKDQAEHLLKSWSALPPRTLGTPMTGAKVPARIQEGLKAGEPVPQIADLVWSVVQADPVAAQAGLDKWAGDLRPPYLMTHYMQLGELALNLVRRWTPEQPAPDWLLTFATAWKDEVKSPAGEVRLELFAILRRFPACKGENYFPAVSVQALESKTATEEELAQLALDHLKAMADRKGRLGSVVLVPELSAKLDRTRGISPLAEPQLSGIGAPLFLLEHAWREEKQSWLDQECTPVLKQVLEPGQQRAFGRLMRLYFCESGEFLEVARSFSSAVIKDKETRGSVVWILRVARLRELPMEVGDWAGIINLPEMISPQYDEQASAFSLVRAWLDHAQAEGAADLGADLTVLLQSAGIIKPAEADWNALLRSDYRDWRDGRKESGSALAFKETSWSWSWHLLQDLATSLDLFPAAVEAAYEAGFLDLEGTMHPLVHGARKSGKNPSPELWQGWIKASGLAENAGIPEPPWLLSWEGVAPVWAFSKFALASSADEVLPWLEAAQKKQPSLGRALLILGTSRGDRHSLPMDEIEKVLTPCRDLVQNESPERRAELAAALLVVQPLLPEFVSAAAPGSVLKLLPQPASAKLSLQFENRWLNASLEEVMSSGGDQLCFRLLAKDVSRLLLSGSPRTDEVLEAGIRLLSGWDWGDQVPVGMQRQDWVREQVGLSLLSYVAFQFSSTSSGTSRGVLRETLPEDDGRRQPQPVALRFLLRHGTDFQSVMARKSFSMMMAHHLAQRFEQTGWDARVFAVELGHWLPASSPDSAWLLLPALRTFMPRAAFTSLENLAAELTLQAQAKPDLRVLACVIKASLESERAWRLGSVDRTIPVPLTESTLAEMRSLLQEQKLSAAARLAVVTNFPEAWPVAELPGILQSSLPRLRLALDSEDPTSSDLSILLPWLGKMPATEASRDPVIDCARLTLHWLQRAKLDRPVEYTSNPGSHARLLISPLLKLLETWDEMKLRDELLLLAAATSRLPLEVLRDELRRDPAHTMSKLIPAYIQPLREATGTIWFERMEGLPHLTQADVKGLALLENSARETADIRMAWWLLSACPDAADSPPAPARSVRMARLLGIATGDSPDWEGFDLLFKIQHFPEQFLPELLPWLRLHPVVHDWRRTPSELPAIGPWPAAFLRPRILCLWAIAEHLHGNNPAPWKKLSGLVQTHMGMSSAAAKVRDKNLLSSPFGMDPLAHLMGAHAPSSEWAFPPTKVLRDVCLHWLQTHPVSEWSELVPLILAAGPMLEGSSMIPFLHEVLIAVGTGNEAIPWSPVKELVSRWDAFDRRPFEHEDVLWSEISHLTLSLEISGQIAMFRLGSKLPVIPAGRGSLYLLFRLAQMDRLPGAIRLSRLMEPATLTQKLQDLPLDTLWWRPVEIVNWLAAAGQYDAALKVIQRLAKETKDPGTKQVQHWLLLAAQAGDLGDMDMAHLLVTKAGKVSELAGLDGLECVVHRFRRP